MLERYGYARFYHYIVAEMRSTVDHVYIRVTGVSALSPINIGATMITLDSGEKFSVEGQVHNVALKFKNVFDNEPTTT